MKNSINFTHHDLKLPNPKWDSSIVNTIIELENLRDKNLLPSSIDIFIELKYLFQKLENWASARIEGNQTELIDALDPAVNREIVKTTDYQELEKLEDAIKFVDEYCKTHGKLSKSFILEVHKLVTNGLPVGQDQPGDKTPGKLRVEHVRISKSKHVPPMGPKVPEYIDELVKFANEPHDKKYDALKVAIIHHRFTWIHPFTNGNGRVTRLLTYAMLQILGYGVAKGHILNPSVIFYADRKIYYQNLAKADRGTEKGVLEWCEYFTSGLLEEVSKIDRLLDDVYVKDRILIPVLKAARDEARISEREYMILRYSLNNKDFTFVSADINMALGEEKSSVVRSTIIKKMRESKLIVPAFRAKQKYLIRIDSPLLIRNTTVTLYNEGFILSSPSDKKKSKNEEG